MAVDAPESSSAAPTDGGRTVIPRHDLVDMFLVAGAGLLLEISYTRIFSFKFFYYYTYLIIGLALLGIGAGGVAVALSPKLREARLSTVVGWCSGLAALLTAVGYVVVAWTPVTVANIWQYGTGTSFKNLALLVVVCVALFAPFAMVGVIISTFFGRQSQGIGRLYFADLIGAGLACAAVVFMIRFLGPPTAIMIAGLILAGVSVGRFLPDRSPRQLVPAGLVAVLLVVGVLAVDAIHVVPDSSKQSPDSDAVQESRWSPIFRVDTQDVGANVILFHDGLIGSSIHAWDGELASLETKYIADARSLPFAVLSDDGALDTEGGPGNVVIVGAAGGNEILTSLAFGADHIDAIELNPVTHGLLLDEYAEYSGRVAEEPNVNYELGDGRSFVERSDKEFDLVWFPAPDSYAASNAASAGAFVLSESYLYTADAVDASLDKLTDDGILAAQFGEIDYENRPYRTARYVSTVRKALEDRGVEDPSEHVLVATSPTAVGATAYSTVLVKDTPFTDEEVQRFTQQVDFMTGVAAEDPANTSAVVLRHAPGIPPDGSPVSEILTLPDDELDGWYDDFAYDVEPITDDAPYFWNFARPGSVLRAMDESLPPSDTVDPESGIGERVLLLLLGISALFAVTFLILPFLAIRKDWKALPRKPVSALYFSCLGMGFLFFEITLIQRLTLFLGYPTYSLTVTLASVLIFTGVGALLSERVVHRGWTVGLWLLGALGLLTLFYELALPGIVDGLFGLSLALRVIVAFVLMAPLGLCLGMFMPLGLGAVGRLTPLAREYVAWGWAVNGFASVMGSVLTTLLSMTFGFRVVMALAFCVYAVAVAALRSLMTSADAVTGSGGPGARPDRDEPDATPAGGPTGQPVPVAP